MKDPPGFFSFNSVCGEKCGKSELKLALNLAPKLEGKGAFSDVHFLNQNKDRLARKQNKPNNHDCQLDILCLCYNYVLFSYLRFI